MTETSTDWDHRIPDKPAEVIALLERRIEVHYVWLNWLETDPEEADEAARFGGGTVESHRRYIAQYRGAIAVIRALRAERVPEGWRLVPVEPTPEQRQRGGETNCPTETLTSACDYAVEVYRAMLDAAPEPPAPVEAPGHTDLMVSPESLDEWLEDNPSPASRTRPTEGLSWDQPRPGETQEDVIYRVCGDPTKGVTLPSTDARLAEALEVLEPFAEAAENCIDESELDSLSAGKHAAAVVVSLGDFRAARDFIRRTKGKETE